ncbi:MAG: GIY-YIG nuclease family protein, partial [Kiritimatiellia bacterium]
MHYVYIIRSIPHPTQTYIGYSSDLKKRIPKHNEGGCPHTAKYKPWRLEWYCAFPNKHEALEFEKYLKSHSGKAFANKRLLAS